MQQGNGRWSQSDKESCAANSCSGVQVILKRYCYVIRLEVPSTALENLDLEGIVAKHKDGLYMPPTRCVEVKNRNYTQSGGRQELVEKRYASPAFSRHERRFDQHPVLFLIDFHFSVHSVSLWQKHPGCDSISAFHFPIRTQRTRVRSPRIE